jgi:sphingosine kinase
MLNLPVISSSYAVLAVIVCSVVLVSLYLLKHAATRAVPVAAGNNQSKPRTIKHITVILNPFSGSGSAEKIFNTLQPILKSAGLSMTVIETTDKGHAYTIANHISQQECDGIICVGGDGLVHEVVNGLLTRSDATIARHIPIGIIPAGKTNNIATSLGIHNIQEAAERIISSRVRPLDIIGVVPLAPPASSPQPSTGQYTYAISSLEWGISSEVEVLADKLSWLRGLKYYAAVFLSIISIHEYVTHISFLPTTPPPSSQTTCPLQHTHCEPCKAPMQGIKGKKHHTDLTGWVVVDGVMNNLAFFVAGNLPWGLTPNAHLSDGYLNLAIVEKCSRLELAHLLVAKRSPAKSMEPKRQVRYYKTSNFRVDVDRCVPLIVDGEFLYPDSLDPLRLQVEVHRGLCLVIC